MAATAYSAHFLAGAGAQAFEGPPAGEIPTTGATAIAICHRTRMFGECLQRILDHREAMGCHWLAPELGLAPTPAPLSQGLRLVLLDASLATDLVASLLGLVRRQVPCCKVLLIVPDSQLEELATLAQWRADGCISESGSLDDLCRAVRALLAGDSYFPPELAGALFAHMQKQSPVTEQADSRVRLTAREGQVLRLITAENLANKQIASRLRLSLYTVKNHVHNLIEKLGVPNRQEAARLARLGQVKIDLR